MHFSIDRTVHTTAFDKPVVDHWLERKITQTAAGSTEKAECTENVLEKARFQLALLRVFPGDPCNDVEEKPFFHLVFDFFQIRHFLHDLRAIRKFCFSSIHHKSTTTV